MMHAGCKSAYSSQTKLTFHLAPATGTQTAAALAPKYTGDSCCAVYWKSRSNLNSQRSTRTRSRYSRLFRCALCAPGCSICATWCHTGKAWSTRSKTFNHLQFLSSYCGFPKN